MTELCAACVALISGAGDRSPHAQLFQLSTGTGNTGGRAVTTTQYRCSRCAAIWQRETDSQSLRQLWFLQAR
jgi:hypothetical protein